MSSFRKSDNNLTQHGIDGNCLTQPCKGAAVFAAYFRSVSNNHSMGDFSADFPPADSLPVAPVSDSQFLKAIRHLHLSKFVRLDSIINICSCFRCYTVHVVELLNYYTNHCTYIKFIKFTH